MRGGRIVWQLCQSIPTVCLLAWACVYLNGYAAQLSKPLSGVTLQYESRDGMVELFASEVQVDLLDASILAKGVRIRDKTHAEVVRVSELKLYLPAAWAAQSGLRAELTNAELTVDRTRGEKWSIERLLPKPTEKPTPKVPYSVRANRLILTITDRQPKFLANWRARVQNLLIAGKGEMALANFDFDLKGSGGGHAELTFGDSGFSGQLNTPGLQLGDVLKHLKSMQEFESADWLREIEFRTGRYSGTVAWEQTKDKPVRVYGTGTAVAEGFNAIGLQADSAEFIGTFNEARAVGQLKAAVGQTKFDITGEAGYGSKFRFAASGTARSDSYASVARLFKLSAMPAGASANGVAFVGSASFDEDLRLAGRVTARILRYGENSVGDLSSQVGFSDGSFKIWNLSGNTLGGSLKGELYTDKTGALSGKFLLNSSSGLKLPDQLASYFNPQKTEIVALVRGTIESPELLADLRGTGLATIKTGEKTWREVLDYLARVDWRDGKLRVTTASINGPAGSAVGQAELNLSSNALSVTGNFRSVDLSQLGIDGLKGIGFAEFKVGGDPKNLRADGRLEAYSASFNEHQLPIASAEFSYRGDEINVNNLLLSSGSSTAKGSINILLGKDPLINGSGTIGDVALSSYVDERVQGLVDGQWWLVGTFNEPQVRAQLTGTNLVFDKLALNQVTATVGISKSGILVSNGSVNIGDGIAQIFGRVENGVGNFHFLSEKLPLAEFADYFGESVTPGGEASLTGDFSFAGGQLTQGNFEASVRNFTINGELVGSGTASVSGSGEDYVGSAQLGSLDGYLLVENAKFNRSSRIAEATVSVLDANIAAIRRTSAEWLNSRVGPEVRSNLNALEGRISAETKLTGNIDDPNIELSFQTADLQFSGTPMGQADAKAVRRESIWTIAHAQVTGGPATMRLSRDAKNFVDELGAISLDGEINNIDLSWLNSLAPEVGALRGTVDIPFTVSGKTSSPKILATVAGKNLAWGEFTADAFEFGPFEATDGQIVADQGGLQMRGLSLNLVSARIPFRFPLTFADSEPLDIQFSIPEADIDTLSRFFGELDTKLTEGKLEGGAIRIYGTLLDWRASGDITLSAPRLKFSSVDAVFADVRLRASVANTTISVGGEGRGESGGIFNLVGEYDAKNSVWLPASHIALNDLAFSYRFENGSYFRGLTFANLNFSGELLSPNVTGRMAVDEALFDIRGEFGKSAPKGDLTFNPNFNVALAAKRGEVRNGLMQVKVNGAGTLSGTLAAPTVDMGFRVIEGVVQLLSGPLKIEQGSVANLSHRPTGLGTSETILPIDLRARTSLTSITDVNVQRYDVTLYITGDLFAEAGLDFDVLSDPPGLTKDDFIGIVGQKQLFASETGFGGNFQDRLKDILSVVSPVFLTPITAQLERAFGLDYIVLNFGSGSLGGVIIGKTIGAGFSLEYRQPLNSESNLNQLDQLTLTYRPPVRNPLVSRLTLGAGLNRAGETSFSLTYSNRFHTGRAKRK